MAQTLVSSSQQEPGVRVIALFSVLVGAWRDSNFEEMSHVASELRQLGVSVKLRGRLVAGRRALTPEQRRAERVSNN